jgi:hypothetical protein
MAADNTIFPYHSRTSSCSPSYELYSTNDPRCQTQKFVLLISFPYPKLKVLNPPYCKDNILFVGQTFYYCEIFHKSLRGWKPSVRAAVGCKVQSPQRNAVACCGVIFYYRRPWLLALQPSTASRRCRKTWSPRCSTGCQYTCLCLQSRGIPLFACKKTLGNQERLEYKRSHWLLGIIYLPDDGGVMSLRNVVNLWQNSLAPHPGWGWVCPYLTGNILRLRYEPNRLMLSVGLWRRYINVTITILDIIHRPVFYLKLNSTL